MMELFRAFVNTHQFVTTRELIPAPRRHHGRTLSGSLASSPCDLAFASTRCSDLAIQDSTNEFHVTCLTIGSLNIAHDLHIPSTLLVPLNDVKSIQELLKDITATKPPTHVPLLWHRTYIHSSSVWELLR